MRSLHVMAVQLGTRLGSLYRSVVCTSRLVHFAYIGAYGSLCLVSFDLPLVFGGQDLTSGSCCLHVGAYGSLCLVSFVLPLVFGGHDFTDENAHTDSDGSLLPKGTPALVVLDIAHI